MVKVEYENALAQAKKLEQAAAECKDAQKQLQKAYNESTGCWDGSSAEAMRAQYQMTSAKLEKAYEELMTSAATIRRVAEELLEKDAELAGKTVVSVGNMAAAVKAALSKFS